MIPIYADFFEYNYPQTELQVDDDGEIIEFSETSQCFLRENPSQAIFGSPDGVFDWMVEASSVLVERNPPFPDTERLLCLHLF